MDLSPHVGEIARRLLGPENRRQSTASQLRFGSNGSIAVEIDGDMIGTWFDHEHNQGGGPLELIHAKLGLADGAAMDWLSSELGIGESATQSAKRRIETTYDYRDEDGKLLFEVVRFAPKDFRQRRPDGTGGWKWSTKGTRMVPYRLPELLAAIARGETVHIGEGEKAVGALRKAGLAATCSPRGAGKWRAEFNSYFKGVDVVVLPDNDEAGRSHANQVLQHLIPLARSVKIVDLAQHEPKLPEKGDPFDWFAIGRTAEDIGWLAESTEAVTSEQKPNLAMLLDIHAWAELDVPIETKLLGDLVTPSSRMFLVGRTGLGKTLLLHALCGGMASGEGFLHWRSERPSRWLIIDGEMPSALIKARAVDLLRQVDIPRGNLVIYGLDRAEEFARLMPGLGALAPINTEEGHRFVLQLAEKVGAEGVAFDNVMSLVAGDQKDELSWSGVLPLVTELTKRKIAQVYADHTGHNSDRQYGTSTKGWRFDAIAIMNPLAEAERGSPGELAFTLSFEHPGKARRRVPDNWSDFENCTIRFTEGRWTSDTTVRAAGKRLSPVATLWHAALLDALIKAPSGPSQTTKMAWYTEASRTGLAEPLADGEPQPTRNRKLQRLRKYLTELRASRVIGVDGETVTALSGTKR